ncbi:MAG: GAF domain-containing protein [Gemmatimonadota bacterium]
MLLVDERTRDLVMVDEHGYPPETRGLRLPLDRDRGLSCWVAKHGVTLYVPDVLEDERYVAGVPEARSELAVPIRFQGRTLGVLNVESDRVDAFEFLVVLPETSGEGVGPAAERIRGAVLETLAAGSALPEGFRVGLSVGTAVHHPGEDLDVKLREADAAMYADKRGRRGERGDG